MVKLVYPSIAGCL